MSRSREPRAADPGSPTEAVDRGFREYVARLERGAGEGARPLSGRLSSRQLLDLFDDQMRSRHLDLEARAMRERGAGYYTIGSSGHEGNAAVAEALRVDDPALLHYRSGAFFLARARKAGHVDAARDVLLGVVAARDEPIAGGRHKVIGSRPLWIPPQTSTIASHLPKAMGLAFALELARHLKLLETVPRDAIVLCSFGDASLNHSTAQGALNAAAWAAHQRLPSPILFVCEDNGIGISVATPAGWVAQAGARGGIRWFHADGTDLAATYDAALDAAAHVRQTRAPAFLHLEVTRLLGHAGSDVEIGYRSQAEIRAAEARDPLRRSAALAVAAGLREPDQILERYEAIRAEVRALAGEVESRPGLRDAADVMAPLAPRSDVRAEATRAPDAAGRERLFSGRLPEREPAATLAQQINRALLDLMARYPGLIVFGEDVARKGGVYGVTRGLRDRAGAARVFDTLLDEQSILGVAQGAGHLGLLPVPEIQYLAYLHNAEDQLRGEAATLQFFSSGQFRCPMVLRIASYAYQKGFGGHFHNDNAVAVLRDIPGLLIASPALGDDAVAMLRTCAALAATDGAVCVFLEPIALYHERDLHEPGDGGLLTAYPPWEGAAHAPPGRARIHGDGADLTIVSFANGLRMSLRVARRLERDGIRARVVDLRWLAPLPVDDILAAARETGRVLVVDETRASGGVSEGVVTALVDAGYSGRIRRVTSKDSFVPLGPAAAHVLLGEDEIEAAARQLVRT
jgi:2-oxoisovalerate dehydrogenase E1 component